MATKKSLDVFLSLSVLFMMITINKLTQRSFRLKHGSYMYIICIYEMAAILNMALKKASGDVESSQFMFTTVKNIVKKYKNFKSDLWIQCYGKHTFYGGHL